MSDLFNTLYDEIFLSNTSRELSDETIESVYQTYISSNVSINDKKKFLLLRKAYYSIKPLLNNKDLQITLYGGKSKREIIMLELARIKKANINNLVEIISQINEINVMLDKCDKEIPDDKYKKIINTIIMIELSLGMKIGLFKELCTLFEDMVLSISKKGDLPDTTYRFRK